ncbi:hypothetical protein OXPF_39170 [Oxobacter pfennigii]|uniref:Bro-N domain-containing protein n=1 Tax=Oxobacter pfennigii TaxID=36849 RepID=A0A0P8WJ57_9CLOT|nr:phage antirepressor [Oxobacter pfennigii]KPU42138.1 hypothetical protein OXPF_39170 [Oxobacter pfennigii]
MSELQIFNNKEFGQVRVIQKDGEPWFIGKDIAEVLGYKDTSDALKKHVDEDDKLTLQIADSGQNRNMIGINESGLYSLILRSNLPDAKQFKRWVTSEVLPSIRKTGGYVSNEDLFINTYLPYADENTKAMFKNTLEVVRQQTEQIKTMKPKAEFFDAVADSKTAIEMSKAAKVLNFGKGRNTLFAILRAEGILRDNNEPYQEYIDRGYFRVIEQKYSKPDGSTNISIKTLVYQKGLDYIRKILNKQKVS